MVVVRSVRSARTVVRSMRPPGATVYHVVHATNDVPRDSTLNLPNHALLLPVHPPVVGLSRHSLPPPHRIPLVLHPLLLPLQLKSKTEKMSVAPRER